MFFYKELQKQFDWVSPWFDGKEFEPHPSCVGEKQVEADKILIKHFNRRITSRTAIEEMDKEGYRPAMLEELLAYAKAYPDEQRKYWIIALGSFVARGSDRSIPFLLENDDGRYLDCLWDGDGDGWRAENRFAFAAKESSSPGALGPLAPEKSSLSPSDKAILAQFASAALAGCIFKSSTVFNGTCTSSEELAATAMRVSKALLAEYKRVVGEE